MKITMRVDASGFKAALQAVKFRSTDLLQIEGSGAKVLINGMRQRVPVDTGATRASVNSHITIATPDIVVDEIGPETNYAPYIEYGVESKPNYPIQPFVRPTAMEDFNKIINAIGQTFGLILESRWPT